MCPSGDFLVDDNRQTCSHALPHGRRAGRVITRVHGHPRGLQQFDHLRLVPAGGGNVRPAQVKFTIADRMQVSDQRGASHGVQKNVVSLVVTHFRQVDEVSQPGTVGGPDLFGVDHGHIQHRAFIKEFR